MPGGSIAMNRPKRQPPRNYFARREQYRLLVLVSMLLLVLLMMDEARKPKNWRWMWKGQHDAWQEPPSPTPIDTRISRSDRRQLPTDGFTALPSGPTDSVVSTAEETHDSEYLPGITRELLSTLVDDTVFRASESKAWLAMFRILQNRSQSELESLADHRVGFIQLFRQTDVYRGHLVTISGTVRRLEEITSRPNELDIASYYRWILAPRAGSNSPIVIYTLQMPDQFPVGNNLDEAASFTGFCYKRWAYLAGDGTRVAPLLLAKNASWQPAADRTPAPTPSGGLHFGLVAALAVLAGVIALAVYASSRVSPEVARRRTTLVENLDRLQQENVLPDVREALQELTGDVDSSNTTPSGGS